MPAADEDPQGDGGQGRYLAPLPAELEQLLIRAQQRAEVALNSGDVETAFEVVAEAYAAIAKAQPKGRRFHKGLPLNQMAIFRLMQGRLREAARLFMDAFIED